MRSLCKHAKEHELLEVRSIRNRRGFFNVVILTPLRTTVTYVQYGPRRADAEEKAVRAIENLNFHGYRSLSTGRA